MDLGTGNGQAAVDLADHFERVIGIEPSAEQLDNARPHPRVEYRVATAEATGLTDGAADLLLAAQAFHWFQREPFFAEARRVLRPSGVLALVSYALSRITPDVDAVVDELYADLDPYWEPERRLVEDGYVERDGPDSRSSRRHHSRCAARGRSTISSATWGRGRRIAEVHGRGRSQPAGRGSAATRCCLGRCRAAGRGVAARRARIPGRLTIL